MGLESEEHGRVDSVSKTRWEALLRRNLAEIMHQNIEIQMKVSFVPKMATHITEFI